jgi:hypothetical protein
MAKRDRSHTLPSPPSTKGSRVPPHKEKGFRVRAPLDDIVHRILYHCMWSYLHDDSQLVFVKYSGGLCDLLDLEYVCWVQGGIDTVLYGWWLTDPSSLQHMRSCNNGFVRRPRISQKLQRIILESTSWELPRVNLIKRSRPPWQRWDLTSVYNLLQVVPAQPSITTRLSHCSILNPQITATNA